MIEEGGTDMAMADDKKVRHQTHVLILPFPGQGHVNPMFQFATRLVSKGVKAALVTTVFYSKSLPSDGQANPVGFRTISDGFDGGGIAQAESPETEVADWLSKFWKLGTIGPTIPSIYLDKRLKNNKDYGLNLFNPNTTTCMTWLNTKPNGSVAYVSFGSLAELESEQMSEVAWGLKQTDAYFLWVVREPEEPKLPTDFLDMTREKGLIVRWCPQLEVLNHESVGCFVSHCGYNSVLEALCLGVPMVAMPQWADQPTNAKYVEEVWGIGIRALGDEKGIVRREILKHCIDEVMKGGERGKEIKKNSLKWKTLAIKAADHGGSSDKNMDEFVAKLLPSC